MNLEWIFILEIVVSYAFQGAKINGGNYFSKISNAKMYWKSVKNVFRVERRYVLVVIGALWQDRRPLGYASSLPPRVPDPVGSLIKFPF